MIITPIQHELDKFIYLIATIAVSCGVIFFCLGFAYGYGVVYNIGFSIGLIVANIPEGLLITITICMAKAAK
mgnify:CR=1 FL=1